ncbi:MAG: hypothetical protein AAGE94_01660 [Acidobacteriota bacterium]
MSELNSLDGFNLQPRLSIPFDGPIDVSTVDSGTLFLLRLGPSGGGRGDLRVGIDQIVWDSHQNTLHVESAAQLDQRSRYALVVTRGVLDVEGRPVGLRSFNRFHHDLWRQPETRPYAAWVTYAAIRAFFSGVGYSDIAAISVFSTQDATGQLEAIRDQIKSGVPAPARFDLAPSGRAHFALDEVERIVSRVQIGTDISSDISFETEELFVGLLAGGSVGSIAFGSFESPSFRRAEDLSIPAEPAVPVAQGSEEVFFNLLLPRGPKPVGGWPIVIYAHGDGPGKNADLFFVGESLAAKGMAVIAISAPGYGGGAAGTLHVERFDGESVVLPGGGRGIDVDGDGIIVAGSLGVAEGYSGLLVPRDGRRQTVIDLMQLVRVIEVGVDVDGDGAADLDASSISALGVSLGGYHAPIFLAVEPNVRAGVSYAGGGSVIDLRVTPDLRPELEVLLASVEPPLTNVGDPQTCFEGGPCDLRFDEGLPLRGQAPVIDPPAGALAIQRTFERLEWLDQAGNPATYTPHLRQRPLVGMTEKSILIQLARGDLQVPNFSTTAVVRAGDLADRTTLYRHDLVFGQPDFPGVDEPDGHFGLLFPFLGPAFEELGAAIQKQTARFLATQGDEWIDPDGADPIFESPIEGPLPEDCGFVIDIPGFEACP